MSDYYKGICTELSRTYRREQAIRQSERRDERTTQVIIYLIMFVCWLTFWHYTLEAVFR